MDRRTFLKGATAGLAVTIISAACDDDPEADGAAPDMELAGGSGGEADTGPPDVGAPDAEPPDAAPQGHPAEAAVDEAAYPQAVLAGAMTSGGALIRGYRSPDAPGAPRLLVWPEADGAAQAPVVDSVVEPQAGFLLAEVIDLEPGQRYAFAFFDGEGLAPEGLTRSPLGRFSTAPAPGARPTLLLGATACTNRGFMPWGGLPITAEAKPDVFCHLGDMVYNDGAETLEEFRRGWHRTLETEEYRALFAQVGGYFTWDDHELTNNTSLYTLPPAVREAGVAAFFEALPIRRRAEGEEAFWMSYRWGDTAEIFILDCRSERLEETRDTPEAQYISPAQMTWLKEALAESPCHFKLIMNSVPITAFPPRFPSPGDRWQGYAAQRDELLDFITGADDGPGVGGVWFLSGDFHMGSVGRLEAEGPRAGIREILVGYGGSIGNPLAFLWDSDPEQAANFFPPEQFEYVSGRKGATLFTFDPEADTVRVVFVDAETAEISFDATYGPEG